MNKPNKRDTRRAADVQDTAEILGVSTSKVQKSLAGTRPAEPVMDVMMALKEKKAAIIEELKQQFHPEYSSIANYQQLN